MIIDIVVRYSTLLVVCIGLSACGGTDSKVDHTKIPAQEVITDSASWLVEQVIHAHGGDIIDTSLITFTFRDRVYVADRRQSAYVYERRQDKDGQQIVDRLTTDVLSRSIDGKPVTISAKDSASYAGSVNSVIYFALLPYNLQDPAVRATYRGSVALAGQSYHKLEVRFGEENGGEDFEDEYMYWFDTRDFSMDYLAYNFLVDKGGARFRKAYNERIIDGIRFADYLNMKPQTDYRDVNRFDSLYMAGGLDSLSLIILEDITVE